MDKDNSQQACRPSGEELSGTPDRSPQNRPQTAGRVFVSKDGKTTATTLELLEASYKKYLEEKEECKKMKNKRDYVEIREEKTCEVQSGGKVTVEEFQKNIRRYDFYYLASLFFTYHGTMIQGMIGNELVRRGYIFFYREGAWIHRSSVAIPCYWVNKNQYLEKQKEN